MESVVNTIFFNLGYTNIVGSEHTLKSVEAFFNSSVKTVKDKRVCTKLNLYSRSFLVWKIIRYKYIESLLAGKTVSIESAADSCAEGADRKTVKNYLFRGGCLLLSLMYLKVVEKIKNTVVIYVRLIVLQIYTVLECVYMMRYSLLFNTEVIFLLFRSKFTEYLRTLDGLIHFFLL